MNYGSTSRNWDYTAKAMIQHILLHVITREVFVFLTTCISNYRIRN